MFATRSGASCLPRETSLLCLPSKRRQKAIINAHTVQGRFAGARFVFLEMDSRRQVLALGGTLRPFLVNFLQPCAISKQLRAKWLVGLRIWLFFLLRLRFSYRFTKKSAFCQSRLFRSHGVATRDQATHLGLEVTKCARDCRNQWTERFWKGRS